jgi:hypothetical protein
VTSTAHINAGHQRTVRVPANEDATTAAAEQEPWRSSSDVAREVELSEPRVPEVLLDGQLRTYYDTSGEHISFQAIVLYVCNLRTCSFYIIF